VSRPALIRRHGPWGPPALLGEWLDARGIPFVVDETWRPGPARDPAEFAFIASLGSNRSPRDAHEPAVAAEIELIARAVELDVPVLGLCYGGQVLAHVLGGTVEPAPVPELGWHAIETDHPALIPAGPWLEWHYERFTTPPGATELARTEHATQAFRHGRHLGTQFHPESTVEVVAGWARSDAERLAALGIEDPAALLAAPNGRVEAARAAAFQLFDAFLDPVAQAAAAVNR
jgi:GMP synthase-like glutamine amidotransferase